MKRTNIKDLAKLLSLNPSTISRALSDHPDISIETKDRVKKAAEEFKYIPNLHAKYFRQKNSGLIALILPEFYMFFAPSLMDGINKVLSNSGYSIIIFISNNTFIKEKEIVRHCLSWVVEGVLMAVSENTESTEHLLALKHANIPVVLLDKVIMSSEYSTITIDDRKAAFEATSFLVGRGHSNILGVFGNPKLEITKERIIGFKEALIHNNVPHSEYDIICVNDAEKMEFYLEDKLRTTPFNGLFIMSDELLFNVYPCVRKLNLYPNQLSIISISDGKLPFNLYPKITHIKHSGFEIGKMAAEVLLSEIKSYDGIISHNKMETFLIELGSVK